MNIKNFFLLIAFFFFTSQLAIAQSPEQFKYQAAARNSSGQVLSGQNVGIQVSIRSTSATGTIEYQETHTATTNDFGLFSLNIGTGTATMGTFSAVNWGSDDYFLQIELDAAGGTSYTDMGTTQLLSVPYALYAKNVENKDDADADATNEIQMLSKAGSTVTLSNGGGTFTDDVDDADADATNEIQTVSKMGSTVTLSNGGGTFTDDVNDADADATNEIQTVTKVGSTVTLSNGGGTFTDAVNDADADATNEIQSLSVSGNTLSLSNSTATVTLPSGSPWSQASSGYIYRDTAKVILGNSFTPSHLLQISPSYDQFSSNYTNSAFRLTGINSWGHGARFNFGDANYVYIEEDRDDDMTLLADRISMRTDSLKIGWGYGMDGARLTFRESFQAYTQSGGSLYRGWTLQNTGIFQTYGPNGNLNTDLSALGANVNHGHISVSDTNGINQAGMFVDASGDGIIFGDIKNFRIPHPTKEGKEIWYASLEGPEAAAYLRGTADMVNGEVFVTFSEDYELVANHTTMTVILTPLSASSKGLAVVEKVANGFRIKELNSGTGSYQVDWEVKCVRKGKENYRAVRDASEVQSVSSLPVVETPAPKRVKVKKAENK